MACLQPQFPFNSPAGPFPPHCIKARFCPAKTAAKLLDNRSLCRKTAAQPTNRFGLDDEQDSDYLHHRLFILLAGARSACALDRPSLWKAKGPRAVAVTFDDLPAPDEFVTADDAPTLREINRKLVSVIRANHIPAIGFVNEGRVHEHDEFQARVDVLRLWVKARLELGNHTYSHVDWQTPLAEYQLDVIRGEPVTTQLLLERKKELCYFRHPYLQVGPDLATRWEFEGFLARRGYKVAPVTIDSASTCSPEPMSRPKPRGTRRWQRA
jgi:hypothetical protein